ncbi:retrotransposon protein, putative, Ty3-gypsy subclass [Panicum miliaceum]|uniref:Retrotransposon protein, putative, Ty3-gypsy subclass n=1 Tax=Panicum miliaceum TaxID=4540 RepID=A0A3L6T313_PANMI|nr:retrotransposon protein, putative, Ty3-gypsy subclass [Panicum miliaceum]
MEKADRCRQRRSPRRWQRARHGGPQPSRRGTFSGLLPSGYCKTRGWFSVGGARVQLRDEALYLEYMTPSSLSGWHTQWFYIGNQQPSLPGWDISPPQCQECWLKKPTEEERCDIPKSMQRIKILKDKDITWESVAYSFIEQRIQALQQCFHLGKSETPKPAASSTGRVGTSADSLPKEPAAASTAEPPIIEDVLVGTGGRDLEPPVDAEAGPKKEAHLSTLGANLEDGAWVVQQAMASTPDQQEIPGSSWAQDAPESSQARQQEEVPEDSRHEEEVPPPRAEIFKDPLVEPDTVMLMMKLGCRFTNYTKSLVERSREKSALLTRIGDVLLRTHDAEDNLEAEKAKNIKL